jgi:thioredoxin-like negative regulator of GroEL
MAEQLRIEPDESESSAALKAYSKLAVGQANLFAERNFAAEAEQAYRIASEILPANVEAVGGLAQLLSRAGRAEEANQLLHDFARKHPNQRSTVDTIRDSITFNTSRRD